MNRCSLGPCFFFFFPFPQPLHHRSALCILLLPEFDYLMDQGEFASTPELHDQIRLVCDAIISSNVTEKDLTETQVIHCRRTKGTFLQPVNKKH